MDWLVRALTSSIGRKYVMGITGLLLCGFLVVHLAGNLLLYVGADAYNNYATALHEQELFVKVAEVGLLIVFAAHLWLAITVTMDNRAARQVAYAEKQTKQDPRRLVSWLWPHNWMMFSGLVVLVFIILHLIDFTFEVRPGIDYAAYAGAAAEGHNDSYGKALQLLRSPLTVAVYTIGSVFLGFHLSHGVGSAFQSLGVNHPKYNGLIHWIGILFALTMLFGFASFPIVFWVLSWNIQ